MRTARIIPGLVLPALALATLHYATPAHANGRYPQAMQFVQDPGDANRLWLRSTYGLVTSADRGATWALICEQGLGMDPNGVFDPMFGVHADRSVVIGLQQGLKRSTDLGCGWRHVVPELEENFVQDVAVDFSDRRRGVAISSFLNGPKYTIEVWETQNNGASYSRISLIESNQYARTIDAAPSDPNRLYLSVMSYDVSDFSKPGVPQMLRSNDRGKNWTTLALPVPPNSDPYIAAVHPTNPDVLYVRTYEENRLEAGNGFAVKSRLMYSQNGGTAWREILTGDAPMLGLAISPDGTEILVGFGDEGTSGKNLVAPADAFGIWHAATSDPRFQRVYDQRVSCLTWNANDIYVCSRLEDTGFDLGVFNNTCPASIRPLFNKKQMSGMLSCAAGTSTAQACTQAVFNELCELKLNCSGPTPQLDGGAPSCWEGGVYEGGTNDASTPFDSGAGGGGGARDGSVSPDGSVPSANEESDDGCSCAQAGSSAGSSPALFAAALALGVGLGRTRRSRR
ncbi:MAG TPA: hypothetical protein VI072_01035 [Polyangiaceae bacterium]